MINIDPTVLYFLALRSIQSNLYSCCFIVIHGESSVEVAASVVVVVVEVVVSVVEVVVVLFFYDEVHTLCLSRYKSSV